MSCHSVWPLALVLLLSDVARAEGPYSKGLPSSPDFFPIAVWLQAPANAAKYRAIGINVYVGLWRGPTAAQIDALEKAGMKVICAQNAEGLALKDRATIVGWMHGDEPDNAQSLGRGKGYGPPILPARIVEGYEQIRKNDPERPVLLNLGQGVAWDGYYGRGVRTNHPEDYRDYLKGCDIASFDIYPAVHDKKEIAGKLEYVPRGVDRLREWTDGKKDVWCCIETTHISNAKTKPTPAQVRTEVWMALIHGARGLIYFAHEFQPRFVEAGLLADAEIAHAVSDVNRQIHTLAPVLNSPTVEKGVSVTSSQSAVPIDVLVKKHAGATYVFAVAMRPGETEGTFRIPGVDRGTVTVIVENRTLPIQNGAFTDRFPGYGVHLYRLAD